jgi:hypothetical protein
MKDISGIPFTLTGRAFADIFFPFILHLKEYLA